MSALPENVHEAYQDLTSSLLALGDAAMAERDARWAYDTHEAKHGFMFDPGDPLIDERRDLWHEMDATAKAFLASKADYVLAALRVRSIEE